jgi:hypothetical protein
MRGAQEDNAPHAASSIAPLHFAQIDERNRLAHHCLNERGHTSDPPERSAMIRKISSGKYRLYSRKKDPKTGRRRNLGTFASRAAAEQHERAVQYFKRH